MSHTVLVLEKKINVCMYTYTHTHTLAGVGLAAGKEQTKTKEQGDTWRREAWFQLVGSRTPLQPVPFFFSHSPLERDA